MSLIRAPQQFSINTQLKRALLDVRDMFVPQAAGAATNLEFNKIIQTLPLIWNMKELPGVNISHAIQIQITERLSDIFELAREIRYSGGLALQLATDEIPSILLRLTTVHIL